MKPKPMVEIGGRPILWHIMKLYAHYGFHEFVVALGYKGDVIKRYFLDYCQAPEQTSPCNLGAGDVMRRRNSGQVEDWTVHLVDTGLADATPAAGSSGSAAILGRETFMADLRRRRLRRRPRGPARVPPRATASWPPLTAVRPPARFGGLVFDGDRVVEFTEKPQIGEGWINGGFFVLEPERPRLHRRRPDAAGNASRGAAGRRRAADGLPARRLLAVHGHAPRQESA